MRSYLNEHAYRIKYLCLHGYLAVDGIEYVIRRMIDMAADSSCFILDMHQVDGISESAARLLNDVRLRFAGDNIALVFSRIHSRRAIEHFLSTTSPKNDRGYLSFEDNDLAVEWCEKHLLGDLAQSISDLVSLADCVLLRALPAELLAQVEQVATVRRFAQDESILTAGQAGDGRVFFIEKGHVSILVPLKDGAHQRITTLGPSMSFGEMALLGQTTRSATVVADCEVICWVLEADDIDRLARDAPQLRIVLLENISRDMADKLRRATQWIAALA
jgi:glutaminase